MGDHPPKNCWAWLVLATATRPPGGTLVRLVTSSKLLSLHSKLPTVSLTQLCGSKLGTEKHHTKSTLISWDVQPTPRKRRMSYQDIKCNISHRYQFLCSCNAVALKEDLYQEKN